MMKKDSLFWKKRHEKKNEEEYEELLNQKEFRGVIIDVFFSKNKWSSVKIELENGLKINAAGSLPNPLKGSEVKILGKVKKDPKYGYQIDIQESEFLDGLSKEERGVAAFLENNISGVGKKTATEIVKNLGADAVEKIKNNPEEAKKAVKGLNKRAISNIQKVDDSEIALPIKIFNMFNGDISNNLVNKIIENYKEKGEDPLVKIEANPYCLIHDINGVGFKTADILALRKGMSELSNERIYAIFTYLLKDKIGDEGHCFLTKQVLFKTALSEAVPLMIHKNHQRAIEKVLNATRKSDGTYDIENADFSKCSFLKKEEEKAIKAWARKRIDFFEKEKDVFEEQMYHLDTSKLSLEEIKREVLDCVKDVIYDKHTNSVYYKWTLYKEIQTAIIVKNMIKSENKMAVSKEFIEESIKDIQNKEGIELEKEQIDAVKTSLKERISVITGGPGTGKTTNLKTILGAWKRQMKYMGREEDIILLAPTGRASQRMAEATGCDNAQTIHRFLMKSEWRDFPIRNNLIIVDEFSMVTLDLIYKLLYRYGEENKFIFVGDIHQLPSIGEGLVLKDFINSCVPTTKLIKGQRNKGSIAINSQKINRGDVSFKIDQHFRMFERENDNNSCINDIIKVYKMMLDHFAIEDICILVPAKKDTFKVSTTKINEILQRELNGEKEKITLSGKSNIIKTFHLKDRVINTKNNYQQEVIKNNTSLLGVFNGECGIVEEIDKGNERLLVKFDDGKTSWYDKRNFYFLDLAYAITIHKSQGSEYKAVICSIQMEHYPLLDRTMFYTAESRAKEMFVGIGQTKAFNSAVFNNRAINRNTNLALFIKKGVEEYDNR